MAALTATPHGRHVPSPENLRHRFSDSKMVVEMSERDGLLWQPPVDFQDLS
jgi:hypothetical protein